MGETTAPMFKVIEDMMTLLKIRDCKQLKMRLLINMQQQC